MILALRNYTFLATVSLIALHTSMHGNARLREKCKTLNSFSSKASYETKNSMLRLLSDSTGEKYLLKQGRKATPKSVFRTLLDVLGVSIAQSVSVKCNDIELIPSDNSCKHKFIKKLPATIHSFVHGKAGCRSNTSYPKLYLRQRMISSSLEITPKFPSHIIANMARHRDLPPLVAVDTFIGNTDRSCANLFFAKKKNEFVAIDFGESFKSNLCKEVEKTISQLESDDVTLTVLELKGLVLYTKTLKKLIEMHKPPDLHQNLSALVKQAYLKAKGKKLYAACKSYLKILKRSIDKNYVAAQVLTQKLDLFITNQRAKTTHKSEHFQEPVT